MLTDTLGGGEVASSKDSDLPPVLNAVPVVLVMAARLSPVAKVVTCRCGQELCYEMGCVLRPGRS